MTDRTDKTQIGDRMKAYEAPSTSRKAFKGQPIVVRLDGNNFHTFTKGLKRPYDEDLSELMVETTNALVERFHCDIAYTQSDEITLIFISEPEDKAELIFDGRFQKIETLTASYASAVFNKLLPGYLPAKAHLLPCFDSRAYIVPNLQEAYHALLWRQQDATKNAVSMGAQALYSQKQLNGKNGSQLRVMMIELGVDFDDYPYFFKRGTFVRRLLVERQLTAAELERIPEKHRPQGTVQRNEVVALDINLQELSNPASFLFKEKKHKENPNGRTFTYLGYEVEIHHNKDNPSHPFEYAIPSIQRLDPTSWATRDGARQAAKDLIDYLVGDFIVV